MVLADNIRPMEILLVEDSPDDIELTEEALKDTSLVYRLEVVRNGAEATDFLHRRGKYSKASVPDVVLLDLNLPIMDGRAVLDDAKTNELLKRIPIIVITQSTADRDILQSYVQRAESYVVKPIDCDQLSLALRDIRCSHNIV